jgi:PiT family inorganic phosphate transporter
MARLDRGLRKETLDKDLVKLTRLEEATGFVSRSLVAPGIALLFLVVAALISAVVFAGEPRVVLITAAAVLGGYMALNIGANDVANNVGPAVGAQALTMVSALVIAAIFESAGAMIAGGDVVGTISKGIIDPAAVADANTFVMAMMAALVSSALWVNLATWVGAPVSTTHSVVGGVMGAGIAAAGFGAVDWQVMSAIAASWVISPLLGGIIAALFLALIKIQIIYRDDKIAAARRWVPILVAVMAGAFAAYLATKGLKRIVKLDWVSVAVIGAATFAIALAITHPLIHRQSRGMENRNQSLRKLFHIPLICSAALLSFAHGANDVANAVGPLAAIVHVAQSSEIAAKVQIPLWVMVIGAFGISAGLVLFGPKLIRMVGQQITKLNPMRAFCVALSAAITVIVASWFGLPVSSTHIAVGAVFGVGFFREWYTGRSKRRRAYVERRAAAPINSNGRAKNQQPRGNGDFGRRKLVRRAHFMTIVTAWIVTVPAAAILAAIIFFLGNRLVFVG